MDATSRLRLRAVQAPLATRAAATRRAAESVASVAPVPDPGLRPLTPAVTATVSEKRRVRPEDG